MLDEGCELAVEGLKLIDTEGRSELPGFPVAEVAIEAGEPNILV